MSTHTLPAWAEDVLRRFGPHPARATTEADPAAIARYARMTERFRRRWHLELVPDVWVLFGMEGEAVKHLVPAQHLLGLMVDMARSGSRAELAGKRQVLADVGRLEDEVRDLAELLRRKLEARAALMHEHLIAGGLSDDAAADLERAANLVATESWCEPRMENIDIGDAINSRKTGRDALALMLNQLDRVERMRLLQPVTLTDKARAAIFNVTHDVTDEEHYSAAAIKKARADLRRR